MYFCFIVVHHTLLNSYVAMMRKDMKKRRKIVNFYFWSMALLLFVSLTLQTVLVCVDYSVLDSGWNLIFMVKGETVIVIYLVFNTIIAWKVLPQLRTNLGCTTTIKEAIFMLVVFEIIMIYRIYVIAD